ncbi:MAG: hypothetical protein IJY65_05025 [Clostridia bacterium]|nr:hypothetical protein [Clostridia bacterium]
MKQAKLKDFLDEYIKSSGEKNEKKSYAEWLVQRGGDSDEDYADSLKAASTAAYKSTATYGAAAESLATRGLFGSGYASYLSRKKEREAADAYEELRSDYSESVLEDRRGYHSYSEDYDERAEKTKSSVIESIKKSKMLVYNDAYIYAINQGLSDADAAAAAKSGTDAAVSAVRESVIDSVINERLTYEETKSLAASLGLGEEDAERLGEFAREYTGYYKDNGISYSDYLKDKLKELQEEKKKSD